MRAAGSRTQGEEVALKYLCCCHRLLRIPAAKPPARQSEVAGSCSAPTPRGKPGAKRSENVHKSPKAALSWVLPPSPGTRRRSEARRCGLLTPFVFPFQPRGTPAARASPPRWTISILSTRLGKCAAFCPLPWPGRAPEAGPSRAEPGRAQSFPPSCAQHPAAARCWVLGTSGCEQAVW